MGILGFWPDCLVSCALICGGQLPGGSPEAKITNSAVSGQLIVVPWGSVRKDWKVMPQSQLSSIIDIHPESGKGTVMRVPYIHCPWLCVFVDRRFRILSKVQFLKSRNHTAS